MDNQPSKGKLKAENPESGKPVEIPSCLVTSDYSQTTDSKWLKRQSILVLKSFERAFFFWNEEKCSRSFISSCEFGALHLDLIMESKIHFSITVHNQ